MPARHLTTKRHLTTNGEQALDADQINTDIRNAAANCDDYEDWQAVAAVHLRDIGWLDGHIAKALDDSRDAIPEIIKNGLALTGRQAND